MIPYSQLNANDVLNQTEVLAAWMSEFLPSADTSAGTVYRELFLRPTAAASVSYTTELETARNSLSLAWSMANPTLADPIIIKAMANNLGVVPRVGVFASGTVKLTLANSYRMVLPIGTTFTFGAVQYKTTQRMITTLTPTGPDDVGLTPVTRTSPGGGSPITYYECVVPVQATEIGQSGNLIVGTRLVNLGNVAHLVEAAVYTDLTGGTDAEDTANLVDRIMQALAAKSLASRTHISAILQENFPGIQSLQIIGACQPEMRRDRINLLGIATGGKVDLYIRTSTLPAREYIQATAVLINAQHRIFQVNLQADAIAGVVVIHSISTRKEVTDMTIRDVTWNYQQPATDVPVLTGLTDGRFSRYQTAAVTFVNEDVVNFLDGGTVYVGVDRLPNMLEIQSFLLDNQNMGSDYLARTPIPFYVAPNLVLKAPAGVSIDIPSVQRAVAAAINQVQFTKYGLSLADIVSAAFHAVPAGVRVMIPPSLDVTMSLPDGTSTTRRISNDLDPSSLVNVYNRLIGFFCWPENVAISMEALA